jgi:tetratricopeptide (TPR) repeat protein
VFAGLDPKKIAESGRPLQDVLRVNLTAAVKELEGSAIGDPLEVAAMQNTLGWSLVTLGESALAVEVLEKSLATLTANRGSDHADTLTVMCNLGTAYKGCGQLEKAVPLFEEALQKLNATLGPDHPWTLTSMNNLATAYYDSRELKKAVPLHEEALARRKATLGPDHPDTLQSMGNLAITYQESRQPDKALPLFKETLSRWKNRDPDHPDTLACTNNLTVAYRQSGLLAKALPLLEDSLKKREARFGPDHPDTLGTMGALGKTYCDANQGEKAAVTFVEFVDRHRKRGPKDSPEFAALLAQVAFPLLGCGQHAAAERLLRECLAIREKKEPNAWTTFNTQSMLGGSLLRQKKFQDAEPLLLKGYEGMKAREKTTSPQAGAGIPEALDRLIELYTALDRPEDAKKWRAVRAKHPNFGQPPGERK